MFDGMESWLPWLTEREHLLTDLLPATTLVLLVEPSRMRDRAPELPTRRRRWRTLATTWGGTGTRFLPRFTGLRPAARITAARACDRQFVTRESHTSRSGILILSWATDAPPAGCARSRRVLRRARGAEGT